MLPGYTVNVSETLVDPDWDAFVSVTPGGHHVQTSCWAQVKSPLGWKSVRIVASTGGDIVGGAQILMRPSPIGGSIAYVTKGPICADRCPELAEMLIQQIVHFCRRYRCRFLAIQPPNNGGWVCRTIDHFGFCKSSLEISPTASLLIDLAPGADKIMGKMKRETRRNIRRSERAGVTVYEGDHSDLDLFYPLYLATARRQGFLPYERKYFDIMWQAFAPLGGIALLIASYKDEAIAAQLLIPFGDTVIAKMCGWSGSNSKAYPNNALFWAAILWAVEHGYKYFDFEGLNREGAKIVLDGKKLPHEARFEQDAIKFGYGGQVVSYPAVYTFIPNRLFKFAFKCLQPAIERDILPTRFFEILRKRKDYLRGMLTLPKVFVEKI